MTDTPAKKRMGRPPKKPKDGAPPRSTFSVRLTGNVRASLLAATEKSGRSLSEEIERRIEQSFAKDRLGLHNLGVADAIAQMLHSIEARYERSWVGDEVFATYAFTRLTAALRAHLGAWFDPDNLLPVERAGQNKLYEAMGATRTPEQIEALKSSVALGLIDEGRKPKD